MKANKYVASICTLFLITFAHAQQEVLYTQYVFSQLAVNPAYAGNDDGVNLTALSRKQWFGMEGSPTSFSLIGQALLNRKMPWNGLFSKTSDAQTSLPSEDNKVGLGFVLFNDNVGVTNTYLTSFAYSYKIQLGKGKKISLGLQGSMLNNFQTFQKLDNPNSDDPVFQENANVARFNFGTGVFFETNYYYVGFSIPQILENSLNPNSRTASNIRQYFFTGGYLFYLDRFCKFKPTIMARYTEGLPLQFDINANLLFNNKIWVGCSYRHTNSLNVILELLFSNNLRMGLGYDYPISEVNKIAHGSAEIMINYSFLKSKKRISNPRYF